MDNGISYNASTGTFSLTLTDTLGVLSGYNIVANDGLSVSKNGNTITITSNVSFASKTITLERSTPATGQPLLMLDSGANQRAVVGQYSDSVRSYVSFDADIPYGDLNIIKTSQNNDGIVSGFRFEVRNSSGGLVGTYTTDSTGRINVPNLEPI